MATRSYIDRPVKVTARLASPLVLTAEGEAPCLYALASLRNTQRLRSIDRASGGRHRYVDGALPGSAGVASLGNVPTPIKCETVDGIPVPKCSAGILPSAEQKTVRYGKRYPIEHASLVAPQHRSLVTTTGGVDKSYYLPLRTITADRVVYFAVLRDKPSRLRQVLRDIGHIGGKSSQGFGAVAGWEVEPCDDDWSWWADSDSGPVLMRRLPEVAMREGAVGFRRDFGACAPPYWDRKWWREIVTPC